MNKLAQAFTLLFTSIFFIACNNKVAVPIIVHNALIYTVDDQFSTAEAMAISDGKIIAIGTNKMILDKYPGDSVVDAKGKYIFPGLIDAHCHFTGYATDMWKCNLVGTTSFEDIVTKVKTYAETAPLTWIYGRGWDQNDWTDKAFPNKAALDSLFPARPVFLKRVDGHAALVNQTALNLAGITPTTVIAGGEIEVKDGKLTGIVIDNAMKLVDSKVPDINDSLANQYYLAAQNLCFATGLTGVHDCGVSEHTIELLQKSYTANLLKMKIFALLSDNEAYYDRWINKGPLKTERLHVGGFKVYADGALGSRGACMLKPYTDKAGWSGFLLSDTAHFGNLARRLASSALQMCTHAIGDSANREILKIYAQVLKGKNDRRWRIEHAQVVDENDFPFFSENNIIPSVQPTHATSDMYWAANRIGDTRIQNAYAYKKLLATNGWMPLGTDFPVEDISPLKTFFAAVVRQDAKGFPAGGFQPEQALSREEAMRGMTIWAARSAFEEKEKGSLVIGKSADFIIVDTDLMKCNTDRILKTKLLQTFINGALVYTTK